MRRPILIVEDDRNDLELMMIALEHAPVRNPVACTRDGQEALSYLSREGQWMACRDPLPAFVLLDIKMPRINGLELLQTIRASSRFRHLPVVVMSSSRQPSDIARTYDIGANAYVVKPIEFSEYRTALCQIATMWGLRNVDPIPLAA